MANHLRVSQLACVKSTIYLTVWYILIFMIDNACCFRIDKIVILDTGGQLLIINFGGMNEKAFMTA